MMSVVLTGFISLGLLERTIFTTSMFQMGSLFEITLLSMGLAYRYKLNQDQLSEKTAALHEQSKLASMGEMIRHISHQWRQPLSEINSVVMKIETDYRRKTMNVASLDQSLEQIENITEHMSKTIQDFNAYFKSDKEKSLVDLEDMVNHAVSLVMSGLSNSDIRVEKRVDHHNKVNIVEGEMVQVLLVLLNNARDAIINSKREDKWIKIRIYEEGSKSILELEDSGGGIDDENLTKVFEPYFTTKFESQGVGIGLYMTKMIVEESLGGKLTVANTSNGAKFTIIL